MKRSPRDLNKISAAAESFLPRSSVNFAKPWAKGAFFGKIIHIKTAFSEKITANILTYMLRILNNKFVHPMLTKIQKRRAKLLLKL